MSELPVSNNPVVQMLAPKVEEGIQEIVDANTVLLADTEKTKLRDIDKALKEYKGEDEELKKAWAKSERARESAKKALKEARDLYSTKVLGEETTPDESEVDEEHVRSVRKVVIESLTLIKSIAESNDLADVLQWANTLEIPQVGRQGTSTVGQKKPRAQVRIGSGEGSVMNESFGEAAKQVNKMLSTDENKTEFSSGDLVSAWTEAGEADTFEFQGLTLTVIPKEKKSEKASA